MKHYIKCIVLVCVALVLIVGCGGKKKAQPPPEDPAQLYGKGMILFNKGKYQEAERVFTDLKNYFPSDDLYALKADLRIADSYFHREEYPEAIVRYMEFKKRNPFHSDIPFVDYQIADAYFEQMRGKKRDQEATRKALTAFEAVIANHSGTMFANKAQEKVEICRERLARHECAIGHFYLRKGKHEAAAGRFATVLQKYPACSVEDEALYWCAVSLHAQRRDAEAAALLNRLTEECPGSAYADKGEKLLASLQVEGAVARAPQLKKGVSSPSVPAASSSEGFPFLVTAQRSERIGDNETVIFTGEAMARGRNVLIRSQIITVRNGTADTPEELVARGDVRVLGGGEEIICEKAVWHAENPILVMTGNAKMKAPSSWIRGDEIMLHLETGQVEIKGQWSEEFDKIPETLG